MLDFLKAGSDLRTPLFPDGLANQRRAFWRFPPGRARQDKTAGSGEEVSKLND
ncbi:hypothetical protein [Chamaesiphon polymorphus]|uniref:hypothetical protein n=1 Tax=Chamaesiphon polymorphus TaxID=2107691 RepID=UPI0015E6B1A3|nr:hypothetical protein [Chamaesiphon polymorphus]